MKLPLCEVKRYERIITVTCHTVLWSRSSGEQRCFGFFSQNCTTYNLKAVSAILVAQDVKVKISCSGSLFARNYGCRCSTPRTSALQAQVLHLHECKELEQQISPHVALHRQLHLTFLSKRNLGEIVTASAATCVSMVWMHSSGHLFLHCQGLPTVLCVPDQNKSQAAMRPNKVSM